ncbi:hypothetical protein RchiOBHm_Chr3g0478201 [Rosa chinensis]|uniref:RNA-directed DNA polymerase n=1 Tax=Rosa chinensis TaxID=74649 RepID=A0A2P6RD33_ROSCH|nr:hypothetical protein RchiOBHm_Chr3g0478201 [Rosa chinensis]
MTELRPIALCNVVYRICSKVLAHRLKKILGEQQWIQGIKVTPTAPILQHLLFADDSFLFGSATEEECQQFRNILYAYEIASGQRVNLQKSNVAFSKNVSMDRQLYLADILGVQRVDKHEKYLGLPTHVGRSKTAAFAYLKEKLTKKVVSWRAKLLSGVGKEILIKSVAQSVPMYVMNCYMHPLGLCDDMHQVCAGFWWGDSEDKNKIHWRSWERLCVPKKEGAGFRDTPSFSWRSIVEARQVLVQGLKWQVGNGECIEIWNHNWIPDVYPRGQSSPPLYDAPRFVEELMDPITLSWDVNLLASKCMSLQLVAAAKEQIWALASNLFIAYNMVVEVGRSL